MGENSWIWLFCCNEISSCYFFLGPINDEAYLLFCFPLILSLFKRRLHIVLLLLFIKFLKDWVVLAAAVSQNFGRLLVEIILKFGLVAVEVWFLTVRFWCILLLQW